MRLRAHGRSGLRAFVILTLAGVAWTPPASLAQTATNAACPEEEVFYNPSRGEDIAVAQGYKVEVFARDLNFPTGIAFQGTGKNARVLVLESGKGLPGRCNDNEAEVFRGKFSRNNPFTPDILLLNRQGRPIDGPIGKPTADGGGFQPDGPAIDIVFERGALGGRLFASDSNQGVRGAPGSGNNTSRIVTVDLASKTVAPFITGLPTGDHPTEQLAVKDGWLFWSQGSTTNAGVTGHDNGAGGNQQEIPCQDIKLGDFVWDSGDGHLSSGYSPHGVARPGAVVPAFEGATRPGICTGAVLRARLDAADPAATIEPVSWGYRNPFGIRFAPSNHALTGCLVVTENGEDERGARPTNNAPDRLQCARQNADGTPDYHGWPDRFGFLDSTQAIFNPIGGPADDNPAAVVGRRVEHVLAFAPQPPLAPHAILPADVAAVGLDFAPASFAGGVVRSGAALVSREGDFGFSPANGRPIEGHDVQLVNFSAPGEPLALELSRFAFNCPEPDQFFTPDGGAACLSGGAGQAFANGLRGINRPVTAMFGPDGALYLVDYGAVRDFGRSEAASAFVNPANAPLVQIPGTGVIWRISKE